MSKSPLQDILLDNLDEDGNVFDRYLHELSFNKLTLDELQ